MATERRQVDKRARAQGEALRAWGQQWRREHGLSQQDLGRRSGYGSDESPKSAAVAISRIESGKTNPAGPYRRRLLETLGRSEEELESAIEKRLAASHIEVADRVLRGSQQLDNDERRSYLAGAAERLRNSAAFELAASERTIERVQMSFATPVLDALARVTGMPPDGRKIFRTEEGPRPTSREMSELRRFTYASVVASLPVATFQEAAAAERSNGLMRVLSALTMESTGRAIAAVAGASAGSSLPSLLAASAVAARQGGPALLGAIAGPALALVGGLAVLRGMASRKAAEVEAESLDRAESALEEAQHALRQAGRWSDRQQRLLEGAEVVGRRLHIEIVGPSTLGAIEWQSADERLREALELEASLLSLILEVQALPIWFALSRPSSERPTDMNTETEELTSIWIEESLSEASAELEQLQERSILLLRT